MKLLSAGLAAVLAIASFGSIKAQTADEIVNKHLEAIGGKAKISQINTIRTESTLDVMGQSAPGVTTIVNGKGFRSEIDFGGQKIIQVVTDKGAWGINPMQGQTAPTPMTDEQAKAGREQLNIGGPLLNYAEKGNKIELVGREDVKGVNAFKLKITNKENSESFFFIDPDKYYILKRSFSVDVNGEKTEMTTVFGDYRKTDFGYVMPYTMEIQLPQVTFTTTVKKVEINQPVSENIFKEG